jgi:ABC-2 type transport system ATP-binding protein
VLPVEARGLVKRYGRIAAVDGVDLRVEQGDIYGYLGPNGAGKTTTLRMLLGLVRPDEGTVRIFDRDPVARGGRALDDVAGFVEAPAFYPYLTGRKNLELLAAYDQGGAAERARIDEVLETVELLDRGGDRVGGYSQGMRQRLGIAASLLRAPRLLILDEPANGLDPSGIRNLRGLVSRLAADGMTILYSSHLLAEVEEVCNRVAIVDRGKLVYQGRIDELRRSFGERYALVTADPARAAALARSSKGIGEITTDDEAVRFAAADAAAVDALTIALGRAGIGIRSLKTDRASLEDVFFRLTERHDEAAA